MLHLLKLSENEILHIDLVYTKYNESENKPSGTANSVLEALNKERDAYFMKSVPFFEKIIAKYEEGAFKTDGSEANLIMIEGSFKALRAIYGIMDNVEKRQEVITKMKEKGFM